MEEEVISQEETWEIIEAILTITEAIVAVEGSTLIIAEEEASKITEVKEEAVSEKDKIAEMKRATTKIKVSLPRILKKILTPSPNNKNKQPLKNSKKSDFG